MSNIIGYYQENGRLYQVGSQEQVQKQAYKAIDTAMELINANSSIKEEPQNWKWPSQNSSHSYSLWNDPVFWMAYSSMAFSPYSGGSCSGPSDCGGGSGGGKECGVVILVAAIVALIALALAAFGISIYQGYNADKIREKLNEIKALKEQTQETNIKTTCDKIIPILKEEYANDSVSAVSTAVIGVGLSLLTVTAIMALYAKFLAVPAVPLSPLVMPFGIAGGATVVGGIALHLGRLGVKSYREEARQRLVRELFEQVGSLRDLVPNPAHVLDASSEQKVCFVVNQMVYARENGIEHWVPINQAGPLNGYTRLNVEQRSIEELD